VPPLVLVSDTISLGSSVCPGSDPDQIISQNQSSPARRIPSTQEDAMVPGWGIFLHKERIHVI
jgi:hypothetical protein